jgi:hypothetical protein
MIAVAKTVYILAGGSILSVGLSHQTMLARGGMEASRSASRIAGELGSLTVTLNTTAHLSKQKNA